MHNSKIYSILEHFDKYEQNRLRKYINSPYFNKNQALIQLFEIFIDHINSEKTAELEKEKISPSPKSNYLLRILLRLLKNI